MLYKFLRTIARMMLRVYFDEVHFLDAHNIPKDKPLVLAANHQSAFIEPVLLGALMPFDVHFITRGDVFVKKYLWFFDATNQIPIFRFKDGFKSMKRNVDSFERVYAALRKGARVIIFCEGAMKWEKKLHTLQKGAARMALGAIEGNDDLDIHILPIGINYENHTRFRRNVKLRFGKPVPIQPFKNDPNKHEQEILSDITEALKHRLQPNVIHVESDQHYEQADQFLNLARNEYKRSFFKVLYRTKEKFQREQHAARMSGLLDSDHNIREKVQRYFTHIGSPLKYRDYVLRNPGSYGLISAVLFHIIVVPLGCLGILFNGLPFVISSGIAKKRSPNPEFFGSLKSTVGAFMYLFYFLLICVPVLIISWKAGLITMFALLLSAFFALYLWDQWPYWVAARQIRNLETSPKELMDIRDQIFRDFNLNHK